MMTRIILQAACPDGSGGGKEIEKENLSLDADSLRIATKLTLHYSQMCTIDNAVVCKTKKVTMCPWLL